MIVEYDNIERSSRIGLGGTGRVLWDRNPAGEEGAVKFAYLKDAGRFIAVRGGCTGVVGSLATEYGESTLQQLLLKQHPHGSCRSIRVHPDTLARMIGDLLIVDVPLSRAVVQVIGKGRSATPGESWAAVAPTSDTFRRDLEEIMRDYKTLSQLDWASVDNDLIREMDVFKANLSRLHPELNSAALEWKFSWDWR